MPTVFACFVVFAATGVAQVQLDVPRANPPFDETAVDWRNDGARLVAGLQVAAQFRNSLLSQDALALGVALEAFRRDAVPPLGRPNLSRFTVTADMFLRQLDAQERLSARAVFGPFAGRWYGEWNTQLVDHHWSDVFSPAIIGRPAREHGLAARVEAQYAWIGDGFGWNLLVRPEGARGEVILGYVYHLEPFQPRVVRSEFPLVGCFDGPQRLIWVTPTAIFFEEILGEPASATGSYAITGFNYTFEEGEVVPQGAAFQAVYTRSPDNRPDWLQFEPPAEMR
jgi:hypothetical protein